MKTFKLFLVSLFILLFSHSISAQNYKNALGLRIGSPYGITGKHFFSDKTALEGILSFGWGGFGLTGLMEIHNETNQVANLKWYYGFGGHVAFWNDHPNNPWNGGESDGAIGVDGILGLEYTFDDIPLNLSIDWIPSINLIGDIGFADFQLGISARYTF